ncbi:putative ORF3 protein [Gemycircularvirus giapa6]|uniref:Putative ORF3 protein n=1 Tax=Giant panda associated gemycircularvirus TaxID=2016461 RepID=A0A220IGQ3_9VIRU|nr:putative ORF3 protein [Giant panda associated gemycircularvirus]ASH99171.1 putative ORF3 protein [Giant panda associated gemycircularvirus]
MANQNWTPTELLRFLETLELNALSHASVTQRVTDFTYMCFAASNGAFAVERLMYSMSTVTTRMLSQVERMRLEATIMRLRMAKLSLEVSNGRAELAAEEALLELRMNGQKSQLRILLRNFGDFARSWILNLWCAISQPSPDLSNGDFDLSRYPTLHPMEYLTLPVMNLSRNGEITFCLEETQVSSGLRPAGLVGLAPPGPLPEGPTPRWCRDTPFCPTLC